MEQFSADNQLAPQTSLPVQPPVSQPPMPVQSPRPKSKAWIFVVIAVVVILAGGTAGAFYFKIWPFSQPAGKKAAFENLFTKVNDIASANYEMNLELKGVAREEGVKPLKIAFAELEAQKAMVERDQNRYRDMKTILESLREYSQSGKNYPSSMSELPNTTGINLSGYSYSSTASDFALMITFESDEAVAEAKRAEKNYPVIIKDKSVTFTKASRVPYYYINSSSGTPQWVAMLEQQDYLYEAIPGDTTAKLTLRGTTAKTKDQQADAEFHLALDLALGDFSLAVDGDLLKKGDVVFGRINRMPSLFMDLSALKQKWVKVTKDDINGWGVFDADYFGNPDKDVSITLLEQLKLALVIAKEEQVLAVDYNLPDEVVEKNNFFVYQVSFQPDKVASWYKRLEKELAEKYGDKALLKLDKTTLRLLESESFKQYMTYINDNNRWKIVVDPRTGYPVRFDSWSRLVPPDSATKLATKQFEISSSLKLTNINQPIVVEEPKETMSVEDMMIIFTGQSKEEYRFEKQTSNVRRVRDALASYKRHAGVYPTTIDQLLLKRSAVTKVATKSQSTSGVVIDFPDSFDSPSGVDYPSDNDLPFIKSIPKDIFSGKDFTYQIAATGYTLQYQMVWPPRSKKTETSSYNSLGAGVLSYINGLNTANEKSMSLEVAEALKKDTDADKLPDFVEAYYGSDPKKKDSDGDGYSDGDEVTKGYNPAGPGDLDYSERWSSYNYDY